MGEAAREHIYDSVSGQTSPPLLDNQVLLAGEQYERTLRLKRHGIEVAVSDSPLIQGLLYCEGHPYYEHLKKTIQSIEPGFDTYNVLIRPRPGNYDPESRRQTEAEARALDATVRELVGKFWLEVNWDQEEYLGDRVIQLVRSTRRSLPSKGASSTKAPSQE